MPDRRRRQSLVAAGALVALVPTLSPAAEPTGPPRANDTVEEVVVIGYRAQEQEAIREKRQYESIGEFLTSDDLGQQPDYNIADGMSRVPGVQIARDEDEGHSVSIRGLPSSFTLGSMDGATLATAWRNTRSMNVEMIPTAMISGVEVLMARTPDVDGNAIGGTYNLRTRSAFDRHGTSFVMGDAFIGYSDSTDVPGRMYNRRNDDDINYRLDGTASFTFGRNKDWGVVFAVSQSQKGRDQERVIPGTGTVNNLVPSPVPQAAPPGYTTSYYSYANTVTREAMMGKLEWRSPDRTFQASLERGHFEQDDREIRTIEQLTAGSGTNRVNMNDYPIDKPLDVTKLDFTWNPDDRNRLSGYLSQSHAMFDQDGTILEFRNPTAPAFDVAEDGRGVPVPGNITPGYFNPSKYVFQEYTHNPDIQTDRYSEGRLDWAFNRDNISEPGFGLQIGVKARREERVENKEQPDYRLAPGQTLTMAPFVDPGTFQPSYADFNQIFLNMHAFETYLMANPSMFTMPASNTLPNSIATDWSVAENVYAAYALAEYRTGSHKLIVGGRFEYTQDIAEGWNEHGAGDKLSDYTPYEGRHSYHNFLPSVTYLWNITHELKLRLAWFEAVGRPDPSDISSKTAISADGLTYTMGNPNLKARDGRSYDFALEYYLPDSSGLISVGAFHKNVTNEIYTQRTTGVVDGVDVDVISPHNAAGETLNGWSLAYVRNRLEFLPGFLQDFGVSANANWLRVHATVLDETGARREVGYLPDSGGLPGAAHFTGNAALIYQRRGFSTRMTYSYVSDRATAIGTAANGSGDRFLEGAGTVNWQARLNLVGNLQLIGEVRDLFARDKIAYRNFTSGGRVYEAPTDVSWYGRQFWLGAAFRY